MKCPKCQADNPEGSLLCNKCGSKLEQYETLSVDTNQNVEQLMPTPQLETPKYIDIRKLNNEVTEFNDEPQPKKTFFSQVEQPNNSNNQGLFDLRDLEQKQDVVHETVKEEEVVSEISEVDERLKIITLSILGAIALVLLILFIIRLKVLTIFNLAASNLTNYFGSYNANKIIVTITYFILVLLLGYDSYKSKQSTISKEVTKNVAISFVLTIISVLIFDNLSNLKNTTIYVNAMLRFIFLVLLSFANVYYRNSYNHLEQKCGIQNIFFEFLIYFDTLTLILLIFS